MDHGVFSLPPVFMHLDSFYYVAIMKSAATDELMHMYFYVIGAMSSVFTQGKLLGVQLPGPRIKAYTVAHRYECIIFHTTSVCKSGNSVAYLFKSNKKLWHFVQHTLAPLLSQPCLLYIAYSIRLNIICKIILF